jgi:hypothetical protein
MAAGMNARATVERIRLGLSGLRRRSLGIGRRQRGFDWEPLKLTATPGVILRGGKDAR